MAAKLTDRSSIPAVVAELTLEEKAHLLTGASSFTTYAVERLGIPSCTVLDGGTGINFQQYWGDVYSRALKRDSGKNNLSLSGISNSAKVMPILDKLESDIPLTDEEQKVADYIRKEMKAIMPYEQQPGCFPPGMLLGATWDPKTVYDCGSAVGREMDAYKVDMVLGSPNVNIHRDPMNGRVFEGYSEDPCLAASLAPEFVKGLQAEGPIANVKHFAANNQETHRQNVDETIPLRALEEIYFPGFKACVQEGKVKSVMSAYNKINGTACAMNHWLLTDVLRKEWGFEGYVMSDWGAVSNRVAGVAAGLDLEMPSSGGINDARIVEAVRSGKLDEKLVDQAVERILTINFRYLENAKPETPWDMEAQHLLSADIAADCMVLLKNEGILPLSQDEEAAFIGEFAVKPRFQGGGSSHINCFKTTSALEAAEGKKVTYARGYSVAEDAATDEMIAEAVAAAKKAKVAVVFAGLPDAYESEGYDRSHMRMPDCQNRLIEAVAEVNPNTVVVLHNGSPVEMPWIGKVKAVLEGYLGGQAVGLATVRVLYGEVNPSGHLPETFPVKLSDNPSYLFYGGEGNEADYREGVFVGYRYYDKKEMDVLFPFGHGLSYTTFAYSNLRLNASEITDRDTLTATVTVTNTGSRFGKTVVQLYVGEKHSEVLRPVRELKGFDKVALQPGESKDVTFTLDKRAFAYWNAQIHDWHVKTGEFTIEVGQSSRHIDVSAAVNVTSTVRVKKHYTMDTIFMDLMADPSAAAVMAPMLEVIKKTFSPDNAENTDAAKEAISGEMNMAMMQYMPLRGALSFGGGMVSQEMLDRLLDQLNSL